MSDILLQAESISKAFGGVQALDGVNLTLRKGEIHCLAGENGSGKSTLIKIISGFYKPDAGVISFDGKQYAGMAVNEAIGLGIQVIYQDFSIFPNLTVAENIALSYELANRKKLVDWKKVQEIAEKSLSHIGIGLPLDETLENLSVAEKQLAAIARAILNKARLIIMDEPTSALTHKEVDKLFRVIKRLQAEGSSVLFVSHKLDEVFEIADMFTIIRNGKIIVTEKAESLDNSSFIYYMTGRRIEEDFYRPPSAAAPASVFKVENLCLENAFQDISFEIQAGEILGITGLLGSGRTELAKTLFGLYAADSGSIYVEGRKVEIKSPRDAARNKIAYVPEDRLTEGLFLTQPVGSNIAASNVDSLLTGWRTLDRGKIREDAERWAGELSIKTDGIEARADTLSGGNQQKVMLGRWLETEPKVLILNLPTFGVDIGSKFDIHSILRKLAAGGGIAIIIISDDIAEVHKNCSRVLIIDKGRITGEYANTEIDERRLAALVTERQGHEEAVNE